MPQAADLCSPIVATLHQEMVARQSVGVHPSAQVVARQSVGVVHPSAQDLPHDGRDKIVQTFSDACAPLLEVIASGHRIPGKR